MALNIDKVLPIGVCATYARIKFMHFEFDLKIVRVGLNVYLNKQARDEDYASKWQLRNYIEGASPVVEIEMESFDGTEPIEQLKAQGYICLKTLPDYQEATDI